MKKIVYLLPLILLALVSCKPVTVANKGGLRITVQFDNQNQENLDDIIKTLRNRVEAVCKNKPAFIIDSIIQNIIVEVPMESDTNIYKELILTKGKFEILEVYDNVDFNENLIVINSILLANNNFGLLDIDSTDEASKYPLFSILYPAFNNSSYTPIKGGAIGYSNSDDTATVNAILAKPDVKAVLPSGVQFYWSRYLQREGYVLYAIKRSNDYTPITSGMISSASVTMNDMTGNFEVSMKLKKENHEDWAMLTRNNIDKALAIVFDNSVYSCPTVMCEINGGNTMLTGLFEENEAQMLVAILQSGELKADLTILNIEKVEVP